LPEKPLRECVNIVLIAVFADADRNNGDEDDIILNLEEDAIALLDGANTVIAEQIPGKWLSLLLGISRQSFCSLDELFLYAPVTDVGEQRLGSFRKFDAPYHAENPRRAFTVARSLVLP